VLCVCRFFPRSVWRFCCAQPICCGARFLSCACAWLAAVGGSGLATVVARTALGNSGDMGRRSAAARTGPRVQSCRCVLPSERTEGFGIAFLKRCGRQADCRRAGSSRPGGRAAWCAGRTGERRSTGGWHLPFVARSCTSCLDSAETMCRRRGVCMLRVAGQFLQHVGQAVACRQPLLTSVFTPSPPDHPPRQLRDDLFFTPLRRNPAIPAQTSKPALQNRREGQQHIKSHLAIERVSRSISQQNRQQRHRIDQQHNGLRTPRRPALRHTPALSGRACDRAQVPAATDT